MSFSSLIFSPSFYIKSPRKRPLETLYVFIYSNGNFIYIYIYIYTHTLQRKQRKMNSHPNGIKRKLIQKQCASHIFICIYCFHTIIDIPRTFARSIMYLPATNKQVFLFFLGKRINKLFTVYNASNTYDLIKL